MLAPCFETLGCMKGPRAKATPHPEGINSEPTLKRGVRGDQLPFVSKHVPHAAYSPRLSWNFHEEFGFCSEFIPPPAFAFRTQPQFLGRFRETAPTVFIHCNFPTDRTDRQNIRSNERISYNLLNHFGVLAVGAVGWKLQCTKTVGAVGWKITMYKDGRYRRLEITMYNPPPRPTTRRPATRRPATRRPATRRPATRRPAWKNPKHLRTPSISFKSAWTHLDPLGPAWTRLDPLGPARRPNC